MTLLFIDFDFSPDLQGRVGWFVNLLLYQYENLLYNSASMFCVCVCGGEGGGRVMFNNVK